MTEPKLSELLRHANPLELDRIWGELLPVIARQVTTEQLHAILTETVRSNLNYQLAMREYDRSPDVDEPAVREAIALRDPTRLQREERHVYDWYVMFYYRTDLMSL